MSIEDELDQQPHLEQDNTTIDLSASESDEAWIPQFQVRIVRGVGEGETFESKRSRTVIGKDPTADMVLRDPSVSRFHCELRIEGNDVVIIDLRSRNGTVVGGTRVGIAYLAERAMILLGRTQLEFRRGTVTVPVELSYESAFGSMVGGSEVMRAVFASLGRVAEADATLLLTGETGTGKDLAAESVHLASARRDGPFVVVDCGAVPGNLLESELFGHERGAFTGADREHKGAFERATGGTLFLDELGELDLELQPKLLRALERRTIQRLGGNRRIEVDVRIIAATNRNLREEVNNRAFRPDLYYRVAVAEVELPPLRKRKDDIPLLVGRILADSRALSSGVAAELSSESFLAELARHSWPGNVRELRNHIERCLLFGRSAPQPENDARDEAIAIDLDEPLAPARQRWLERFERRYLRGLLAASGDNVSEAARRAGVNRCHFHRMLSRHGLR